MRGTHCITNVLRVRTWGLLLVASALAVVLAAPVAQANDPPVAVNDAFTAVAFPFACYLFGPVLVNDSDPNGDPLRAILVTAPSKDLNLDLFGDGYFIYCGLLDHPDFTGVDTFTYKVNDGSLDSNVAVVTITLVPPGNAAPVAIAGADETAHLGTTVTLDGTASFDPDGNTPLTYAWAITGRPGGSAAILADPATPMPSLVPDVAGDYIIELTVSDSLGLTSAPDAVRISTFNTAPTADAGSDQPVLQIGAVVQLDGSKSFDLDGDPFTYAWSLTQKPQGSVTELSETTAPNPTFVADVHGDYVISLVVKDSFGATSAPDEVTVSFENVRPVADAGENQSVSVGATVELEGSGSQDANGDEVTYFWSLVSTPAGSTAALDAPETMRPRFVADRPGMYVASLFVNDGFADSDPSHVTITAVLAQTQVVETLEQAITTINGLADAVFKNPNLKNALTNKIMATLQDIDQGRYQDALDKLTNDILAKTDGCAASGTPDKNDWLKDCTAQAEVYELISLAIALLASLI